MVGVHFLLGGLPENRGDNRAFPFSFSSHLFLFNFVSHWALLVLIVYIRSEPKGLLGLDMHCKTFFVANCNLIFWAVPFLGPSRFNGFLLDCLTLNLRYVLNFNATEFCCARLSHLTPLPASPFPLPPSPVNSKLKKRKNSN